MTIVQQTEAYLTQKYREQCPELSDIEVIFLAKSVLFFTDFWASRLLLMREGLSVFIQHVEQLSEGYFMSSFALFLQDFDDYLMKNAQVRKHYKVIRKQKRTLETSLGTLTYERRYYQNLLTGEYVYLLDRLLRVGSRSRLTTELQARLLENACEHSYRESCRITCQDRISPTTCMNLLHKVEIPENLVALPEAEQAPILHIHADEDHVARQDQDHRCEVRMAVMTTGAVHEGKKSVLKNKHYVFSYGEKPEVFWQRVQDSMNEVYGDGPRMIYLHGDGAPWIKRGLKELEGSRWVLDRFHLVKYLKKLSRCDDKVYKTLLDFIEMKDKKGMRRFLNELSKTTTAKPEDFDQWRTYVLGNWEGAMTACHDPLAGGSTAEGLVSHTLSSRLSSRPMAWSARGLSQMAKLREYRANGGDFNQLGLELSHGEEDEWEDYGLSASDIPEFCGCVPKLDCILPMPSQLLYEPKMSSRRLTFLAITEGRVL